MKHFLCPAFAALALLLSLPAPATAAEPLTPPERAELLGRLQALHAQFPSFEAAFSEQRTSLLLKKPLVSTGHIAFQIPNKFRREVTGSNPSVTISNGRDLWIYYPNFNEAELCPLGKHGISEKALTALTAGLSFTNVEEMYRIEITPEENGGHRMVLVPKGSDLKRIVAQFTILLDKDLTVRRTDLILPKGDQIITTYTNARREAIPASTFEFVPPAGANITRPLGK